MGRTRARTAIAAMVSTLLLSGITGCARSAETGGVSIARQGAPATSWSGAAPEKSSDSAYRMSSNGAAAGGMVAPAAPAKADAADRMVIRSGNLRLEVTKVPDTVKALRSLAAKYGGSVADLQLSSDDGGAPEPLAEGTRNVPSGLPFSGSVTVKVPVAKLDAFRGEVERLGKVLSEQAADEDVTQQHADLAARLKNAQAEEARLRSFFDKARSVGDMLSIEKELARVRGDIESMTAQLLTMERQAAMATLTVELVEPKPIVRPAGIDWGFGEAVTTGVQGLASLLQAALVMLIAGAPVWIGAIAAIALIRWRMRVRVAKRAQNAS